MKTLEKVLGSLILSIGFLALMVIWSGSASASVGVRAPKRVFTFGFTNAVSSVTTFTQFESTSGFSKAGAVYQVILGTGASTDYLVLLDSNTGVGYAAAGAGPGIGLLVGQIGPRLYFSSATQNSSFVFDPPLLFTNGLMAIMSSAVDTAGISWEEGRGLSGN
jgi:hypothetical protein